MKVLFVCRGNVGRSQIAEALFNKKAPSGFTATSAGTKVFDKEGNSVDGEKLGDRKGAEVVIEALEELGIDVREAVRNQVTEEAVESSDIVVVMAEKETLQDYLLNNEKIRYWSVGDPKNFGIEGMRDIRELIGKLVDELIKEISVGSTSSVN